MHKDTAGQLAAADGEAVRATQSIGYAINLVMDYGSGRQVTISGCLPLGAQLGDFNRELDKLRLATNRQQAFVILRDRQARLNAERKMVESIKVMVAEYDKGIETEMQRVKDDPDSQHGKTGTMRTVVKQQIENLRAQAGNWKAQKQQELLQHEAEVGICETIIASVSKEIDEIDGQKEG